MGLVCAARKRCSTGRHSLEKLRPILRVRWNAMDIGRLYLVPAHIEEFVKAGVKRARLARRVAEFSDFEPGIEATKSIATAKPASAPGS
jgi:hypothetical protein